MADEKKTVDLKIVINNAGSVWAKPFVPGKFTCCSFFPTTMAYKHITMDDFGPWINEEDVIDEYAAD